MNEAAEKVIMTLNANGYDGFMVGGCVRDYLMGREPNDYDVATNASVEQMKAIFDYRAIGSGETHGTLLVLADGADSHIEVTTYREGTHTLEEDMLHRDFTMNAIAFHPVKGLVDPYGGEPDIRSRVIRGVADAPARFREDPLRILRGLRFAACLGFGIEGETSRAMHELADTVRASAPERVQKELTKILCGDWAVRVLDEYRDVLAVIIPEIVPSFGFEQHNSHHDLDVYAHTLKVIEHSDRTPVMRWSALLHDLAKPECFFRDSDGQGHFYGHDSRGSELADGIMSRLKFDNRTRELVAFIIKYHCINFPESKKVIRRHIAKFGRENYAALLEFQRADLLGHANIDEDMRRYDEALRLFREVESESGCLSIRDLAVNGHDVMSLGFQGREVGDALSRLLEAVIDERVSNDRDELLRFLL